MKLLEKFKKQPEIEAQDEIEKHTESLLDLESGLRDSVDTLTEGVENVTTGLVSSMEKSSIQETSSGFSRFEEITLDDESLNIRDYSAAGIGYSRSATYSDGDTKVKIVSGADFDTAQKYTRVTLENLNNEDDAMYIDIDESRITTSGVGVEDGVAAAAQVIGRIGPVLSEINAKGTRS